jgi:divinyl protochlorophyllide a 8-vinyl-reductase
MNAQAAAARIGPNAILRVMDALREAGGEPLVERLMDAAGLRAYLRAPPQAMVPEDEVCRLHLALHTGLPEAQARSVARRAGTATGDYLLAHRIPGPVQMLLRALPAPLAARVLLAAIRRHAWTFAGSAAFTARAGHPVVLTLQHNPLCRGLKRRTEPACGYYAATFERLFRALVHRDARCVEVACEAQGAPACRFEIRWRGAA